MKSTNKIYDINFITCLIASITFIGSVFLIELTGCQLAPKSIAIEEYEVPMRWSDMTLYVTKNTPANSPTFASRALGYIGLTMYESVVDGYANYKTLAGQLNQLSRLPVIEKNKKYNWILSLNAGQAFILKSLYIQTSDENKKKIDSLESEIQDYFSKKITDKEIITRSVEYGKAVASAIFEWSKLDGGHRGYLANFDTKTQGPSGPGSWKPPFFGQTISRFPLHPYWGKNRTFLCHDSAWIAPAFVPYDSSVKSKNYKQFAEVYNTNKNLTLEQKEIALWWNDDPTETYTPPGHSYNLATIVIKGIKPPLIKCAATYAKVGLAVADAFIICWKLKYNFFSERPSTFINENIDDEWEPFWPDPPFPAFPSGHATQAAAVAVVLSELYGEKINLIDNSHEGRPKNEIRDVTYKPRKFNSFWQVAEETAYSRFLGGIHTAYDNAVGLQEGSKVGHHVNELKWNK